MIRDVSTECGGPWRVRVPETQREIAEYRVFIVGLSFDGGPNGALLPDYVPLAAGWAARHLVEGELPEAAIELAALCEAICESAMPARWQREDLRRRMLAQAEVSSDDVDMFTSPFEGAASPVSLGAQLAYSLGGDVPVSLDLPPWAYALASIAIEVRALKSMQAAKRHKNVDETHRLAQAYGLPTLH